MQRDIFKPTLLSLVIAQSLLTACSPSPSNSRDTSPATPVIASPTPVVAAPSMMMEAAAMSKMARYSPIMPVLPIPHNNSEKYQHLAVNPIHQTATDAVATFSIDTDTGSYANVRRFLNNGQLPPTDAVRIEELINYFNYDFSQAKRLANAPFLVSTETVAAPWRTANRIIKVAIKADDPTITKQSALPPANLVFLVDVSGSMSDNDKLPLVKSSLKMLTKQLRAQDTISIVTYVGRTQVTLPATKGSDTDKILAAIDSLDASGSTNGEAAIKLAYQQAKIHYKKDGINRILMMTDGDFNVGVSDVDEMLDIIRRERDSGVSLSTFGFGEGNLNDHMMEQVADNGNGNYSYIDSLSEAKKALVDEMSATFNTVAKDVKVQVEFNPQTVKEWRLIGYENRVLAKEDFNNDKVDAGELGAGKSVVALFEVTPVGQQGWLDDSRYQAHPINQTGKNTELGFLKLRYKAPNSNTSTLLTLPISNQTQQPSSELAFALSVASFGETLKQSKYLGNWQLNDSKRLAQANLGNDPRGIRREFIKLIDLADSLQPTKK
ncbi:VWA domain-containing protein [Moraxella osloensis]|uniref:vWA domain-containing protein n=1 Tax=Moraxella sp. CTOTU49803 TaxID=2953840 RepID=UPI0024C3A9B4|nr:MULTISPECIES: VWA domain-containing protein [Moraxella]MDK1671119.1 VWA domain-containing protein [Moraxella osloensis]